jgi:hypothetical protein
VRRRLTDQRFGQPHHIENRGAFHRGILTTETVKHTKLFYDSITSLIANGAMKISFIKTPTFSGRSLTIWRLL